MTLHDRRVQFRDVRKTPGFTGWIRHQQKMGFVCFYCGEDLSEKTYHVDHYIPLKLKGKNTIGNFRISCPHCNLTKNAKHPDAFFPTKKLPVGQPNVSKYDAAC